MHPIEALNLHCIYHSGKSMCEACLRRLPEEAVIIYDQWVYGANTIKRHIHYWDNELQKVCQAVAPGPKSLVGENRWDILPKRDVVILIGRPSEKFNHKESFMSKLEELYTFEIFNAEARDYQAWRDKRKKPLF